MCALYQQGKYILRINLHGGIVSNRLFSNREKAETWKLYDRIIRVDQAGELGADRIYAGQMFVLGKTEVGPTIQHMWDQEKFHLKTFNEFITKYRARPTILSPVWNIAGFVLGAGTAMLGKEAAMACTVAVEESISEHYNQQLRTLLAEGENNENINSTHSELLATIKQFRDEEMEHHDIGLDLNAEKAPAFSLLKSTIQLGCGAAIWLSERV
uniref:5-demethoxyubiquinone hydroxylase, mitochondrial n=1 Tax=Phallusia mammillata TaxID=59560 RepID=A0A6F9DAH1_9ASCI|nr:ubiquinone biosynthesis protein COQ7 homolog [Phallusia mammillata]